MNLKQAIVSNLSSLISISSLPSVLSDEEKAVELAAELVDEARRLQDEDYRSVRLPL